MAIKREDLVLGKSLGVVTLCINQPKTNVLDLDTCLELVEALEILAAQNRARVVILRGEGRCFSTGVDILQHNPEVMPNLLPAFHQIFDSLLSLNAVTIAAVHGYCLGGAAELAFACDRVIVEESAKIGFPEITVGCYPPVALCLLPFRTNFGAAVKMLLSGESESPEQLARWGLVDTVCASGELDTALSRELEGYADKSPAMLGITSSLLHQQARRGWADQIGEFEQHYLSTVLPHADASEGIDAFLNKRKPYWCG